MRRAEEIKGDVRLGGSLTLDVTPDERGRWTVIASWLNEDEDDRVPIDVWDLSGERLDAIAHVLVDLAHRFSALAEIAGGAE